DKRLAGFSLTLTTSYFEMLGLTLTKIIKFCKRMGDPEGGSPPAKKRETYALPIISLFPSLRNPFLTKGYINQDFALLFNAETSNKLLERWETAFKQKIINEAHSLTSTAEIWCLLNAAGGQGSENGWHDLRLRSVQQRLLTDLCISIK
uniref:Uncharacterized protein n=1 Tax=Cyprinus carpio carpio TaxID=630221 RepID=A0A9J8A2R1_CYPCA